MGEEKFAKFRKTISISESKKKKGGEGRKLKPGTISEATGPTVFELKKKGYLTADEVSVRICQALQIPTIHERIVVREFKRLHGQSVPLGRHSRIRKTILYPPNVCGLLLDYLTTNKRLKPTSLATYNRMSEVDRKKLRGEE